MHWKGIVKISEDGPLFPGINILIRWLHCRKLSRAVCIKHTCRNFCLSSGVDFNCVSVCGNANVTSGSCRWQHLLAHFFVWAFFMTSLFCSLSELRWYRTRTDDSHRCAIVRNKYCYGNKKCLHAKNCVWNADVSEQTIFLRYFKGLDKIS